MKRFQMRLAKRRTPLDASLSPYINSLGVVRRFSYGRFQAALDLVAAPSPARVLDVGCWDGHFLPSLVNSFPEVWAVDDDSSSAVETLPDHWTILQVTQELCAAETVDSKPALLKVTASSLPFPDRYFDVVFCLDTLVHISEQLRRGVIDELKRITKGDGQVIFSLPIETGPMRPVRRAMRRIAGKQIDEASIAYDFRPDLALLRSRFRICKPQFRPFGRLGVFNWSVFIDCRGIT